MTEWGRNDSIRFGLAAESRRHVKISKHAGPEYLPRLRLWKRLARPAVALTGRDLSTAIVLRIREAQSPLKMTELGESLLT